MRGWHTRYQSLLWAGLTLASGSVEAAGFGKKCTTCPTPCESCPPVYMEPSTHPSIIEPMPTTPPLTSQTDPNAEQPVEPMPVPAADNFSDAAFNDSLTGAFDVASASNFSAPNMIGDIFGAGAIQFISSDTMLGNGQNPAVGSSPGTGGGVGRIKLSNNTNIIPRDRVFFGYEFFDSVPITANGTDVNRWTPGFEKTFFGGLASVEVRVPFAGTIDSTQDVNSLGANNVELGNVTLFFKSLLYSTPTMAVGAGLTVTTPTADDLVLTSQGQDILRIQNEGTHLAPYMGVVFMPGRFFTQIYGQYDVDATGRSVLLPNDNGALVESGQLTDTSVFFLDASFGYWIYQSCSPCKMLTGIAPIFEVHYNAGLGNGDQVTGVTGSVIDANDSYDIVNLTFGTHLQFRQRTGLTLAVGVPVTDDNGLDRQFGYEVKVLLNHTFGRNPRTFGRPPVSF